MSVNLQMHTFVCGISGSGKTYRCAEIFAAMPQRAVFVNTQYRDFFALKHYSTFKGMKEALNTQHKIVWDCDDEDEISRFMEMVEYSHRKGPHEPLFVFVDEADDFAGVYSRDADLTRLATKLRNWNIYGVFICQRTTGQLSRNIIGNCHELLIFSVHPGDFDVVSKLYHIPKNPPLHYFYHYRAGTIEYYGSEGELLDSGNIWADNAEGSNAKKPVQENDAEESDDENENPGILQKGPEI